MASNDIQAFGPQDLGLQMTGDTAKPEQPRRDESESEPSGIFLRICKNFSTVWYVFVRRDALGR